MVVDLGRNPARELPENNESVGDGEVRLPRGILVFARPIAYGPRPTGGRNPCADEEEEFVAEEDVEVMDKRDTGDGGAGLSNSSTIVGYLVVGREGGRTADVRALSPRKTAFLGYFSFWEINESLAADYSTGSGLKWQGSATAMRSQRSERRERAKSRCIPYPVGENGSPDSC
jgi:hypothetical protein